MSFFINNHILSIALPLYIYSIGGSAIQVGWMAGIMSLFSTVTRPSIGVLLDKRGRRKPILSATVILALTSLAYLWTKNILSIITIRALQGVCFAVVSSGYLTVIGDLSLEGDRSKLFGYAGLAMPISLLLSPIATEYLIGSKMGYPSLFVTAAIVAMAGVVAFNIVTRQNAHSTPKEETVLGTRDLSGRALVRGLKDNIIGAMYLGAVDMAVLSFIPIYVTQMGLSYSLFLSTFALGMIPFQFSVGRIIQRLGTNRVNLLGQVALGSSLILASLSPNTLGLVISALLFAIGFGCVDTSLNLLALLGKSPENSGRAIGYMQFFINAGRALGSFLLGYLAEMLGYQLMFSIVGLAALLPIAAKLMELLKSRKGV
jgi:MFS family permease